MASAQGADAAAALTGVDAYERQEVLGRGTMGCVFLVRRRTDGLLLALKTVVIASSKDRELALNEIHILRALDHPHIVRFVDSFVADEELCIAMDYCAGGDLTELLNRQRAASKRLPEVEVRSMLAQLSSALAHVHARRIVHRDIKSSNIFLRAAPAAGGPSAVTGMPVSGGGRHHLMLGDFGVAKALESTKAMACTQCGTPYYLPPEVCNGAPYDVKADLWSLGVLAYELIALRYPFTGQTLPQLIMRIIGGKYTPLPSSVSAELRLLVTTLLQQRPQFRTSAEALLLVSALMIATDECH